MIRHYYPVHWCNLYYNIYLMVWLFSIAELKSLLVKNFGSQGHKDLVGSPHHSFYIMPMNMSFTGRHIVKEWKQILNLTGAFGSDTKINSTRTNKQRSKTRSKVEDCLPQIANPPLHSPSIFGRNTQTNSEERERIAKSCIFF